MNRCAVGANVVYTGLRRSFGHINDGLQPQLLGSPGHTAAMVTVGGRDHRHLSDTIANVITDQSIEIDRPQFDPKLGCTTVVRPHSCPLKL